MKNIHHNRHSEKQSHNFILSHSLKTTCQTYSPLNQTSRCLTESQNNSSTVSNIKMLCLSLLQTHGALNLSSLDTTKSKNTTKDKSEKALKRKNEIVLNDSVKFQQQSSWKDGTISSKQRLSPQLKESKVSKSIQKKVFEHILEQYKQPQIEHKHKQKSDKDEHILKYFELKKTFLQKLHKLPNYKNYLSEDEIDLIFKQCFSSNMPQSRWQLHALSVIEKKRKRHTF